jgi:hypothetical protein
MRGQETCAQQRSLSNDGPTLETFGHTGCAVGRPAHSGVCLLVPEVGQWGPETHLRGQEVDQREPEVRQRSPEAHLREQEVHRRSLEAGRRSPETHLRD